MGDVVNLKRFKKRNEREQSARQADANRARFAPGDVLFVPAGVPHRFEDFSDDLVVWVMFYGPEGGEARLAAAP